ncbi:uncharacterized protein [Diadema antillarum]|uniref:uncharacterized protein n=1 Tax=Diadema antillarum TaxID=105358 RepID=UPI003A86442A
MPASAVDSPVKCQVANPPAESPAESQEPPPKRQKMGAEVSSFHEQPVLRYAKLAPDAKEPVRGSDQAAGYDLFSNADMVVPSKGKALVPTDIQIALPEGCYGRIAPRSGLAVKKFIDVGAGVIDRDYRGNVRILLFNFSEEDFQVNKGDRIAQLVCEKIFMPSLEACESLEETERGAGGFGSTGTK